jgi:hypothetical protein
MFCQNPIVYLLLVVFNGFAVCQRSVLINGRFLEYSLSNKNLLIMSLKRTFYNSSKIISLVVLTGFFLTNQLAEAAVTTFVKIVGGSGTDNARTIVITPDGGYIAAGYTTSNSNGFTDIYVLRFNSNGDTIWTKKYGSTGVEQAFGIEATNDGNYVIVGYTTSWGGGGAQDGYLIKIDIDGNRLWEKFYGGSGTDGLESVQETSDGGLILCGYSNSAGTNGVKDVYLVKTDANGNESWSKKIGGGADDWGNIARQTSDGGYIIIGGTYSYGAGNSDYYMLKTNSSGTVEWYKTYGGAGTDEGKYIRPTSSGFIITGDTDSRGAGMDDAWVIKTDLSGDSIWSKTYGGENKEASKMILKTNDGGYILSAITRSFGLWNPDSWIIKLNSTGDIEWEKKYGGSSHEHNYATLPTADGGYISVGHSDSYGNLEQVYLIKTNSTGDTTSVVNVVDNQEEKNIIHVYPNPCDGKFMLMVSNEKFNQGVIKIYNVTGSLVKEEEIQFNANQKVDMGTLAKGTYLLNIISGNKFYYSKIMIE